MVINKKYAAIAVRYTDNKRQEQGVTFNSQILENYIAELRRLAQNNEIIEGQPINDVPWQAIREYIMELMQSAIDNIETKDENFKKNVNAKNNRVGIEKWQYKKVKHLNKEQIQDSQTGS